MIIVVPSSPRKVQAKAIGVWIHVGGGRFIVLRWMTARPSRRLFYSNQHRLPYRFPLLTWDEQELESVMGGMSVLPGHGWKDHHHLREMLAAEMSVKRGSQNIDLSSYRLGVNAERREVQPVQSHIAGQCPTKVGGTIGDGMKGVRICQEEHLECSEGRQMPVSLSTTRNGLPKVWIRQRLPKKRANCS